MKVNSPSKRPLSTEKIAHLEKLKSVVKNVIENSKFSTNKVAYIKSIIWANDKVAYEALRKLHTTIRFVMGNEARELEWQLNS